MTAAGHHKPLINVTFWDTEKPAHDKYVNLNVALQLFHLLAVLSESHRNASLYPSLKSHSNYMETFSNALSLLQVSLHFTHDTENCQLDVCGIKQIFHMRNKNHTLMYGSVMP